MIAMDDADTNIAALLAELDHPDKPKIRAAVDALITLADKSPALQTQLNDALNDRRRKNHWAVAYVLGRISQPSDAVVRSLLDGLDHREPDIRWAIELLLLRIAKGNSRLLEALMRLCADGTANQKRMAVYCLRDLNLTDAASLRALTSMLGDADSSVRVAAVTSLKTRVDIDDAVRNRLLQVFLNDPEPKVQNAAAVTLAQIEEPPADFLPALRRVSEGGNKEIRKAALAALALMEKKKARSVR